MGVSVRVLIIEVCTHWHPGEKHGWTRGILCSAESLNVCVLPQRSSGA